MLIAEKAVAGSLESSDLMVTVEPAQDGVSIEIHSGVMRQYGRQIRKVVQETLERLEVTAGKVKIVDNGALDCTIKARVESAVFRSAGCSENIPWGGMVRE